MSISIKDLSNIINDVLKKKKSLITLKHGKSKAALQNAGIDVYVFYAIVGAKIIIHEIFKRNRENKNLGKINEKDIDYHKNCMELIAKKLELDSSQIKLFNILEQFHFRAFDFTVEQYFDSNQNLTVTENDRAHPEAFAVDNANKIPKRNVLFKMKKLSGSDNIQIRIGIGIDSNEWVIEEIIKKETN